MTIALARILVEVPQSGINWEIQPELGNRRVLRPGRWRPARAVAWAVALVFAIVLVFGPGTEALAQVLPKSPVIKFLVQAVGACIVLGTYAALVRLGEDRTPGEIRPGSAPAGIFVGLAIGTLMFAVVMAILTGGGLYRFDYHGPASAWHGAGLAIEAGVFEEVLVRGVILRLMWRAFGPVAAFAISALLFGAGHVGNPGATWFTTACIAVEAGVMLGSFYALTGRLWVSIGIHAGWNFTQGYLFGAAVSGGDFGVGVATSTASETHPAWLTGGTFGPEASLPAFFVCTSVGIAVLLLAHRAGRFRPGRTAVPVGGVPL